MFFDGISDLLNKWNWPWSFYVECLGARLSHWRILIVCLYLILIWIIQLRRHRDDVDSQVLDIVFDESDVGRSVMIDRLLNALLPPRWTTDGNQCTYLLQYYNKYTNLERLKQHAPLLSCLFDGFRVDATTHGLPAYSNPFQVLQCAEADNLNLFNQHHAGGWRGGRGCVTTWRALQCLVIGTLHCIRITYLSTRPRTASHGAPPAVDWNQTTNCRPGPYMSFIDSKRRMQEHEQDLIDSSRGGRVGVLHWAELYAIVKQRHDRYETI